jgi:hypothetical protein
VRNDEDAQTSHAHTAAGGEREAQNPTRADVPTCMLMSHGGGTVAPPSGMPSACLSSTERFPGFFSFSLISNSFPS